MKLIAVLAAFICVAEGRPLEQVLIELTLSPLSELADALQLVESG